MQSGIEIDCKWRKRRGRRRSWRRGSGVKLANPTDKIEKNKFYPAFFSPVRWSFGLNPSLPFCNLSAAVGGLYASVTERWAKDVRNKFGLRRLRVLRNVCPSCELFTRHKTHIRQNNVLDVSISLPRFPRRRRNEAVVILILMFKNRPGFSWRPAGRLQKKQTHQLIIIRKHSTSLSLLFISKHGR